MISLLNLPPEASGRRNALLGSLFALCLAGVLSDRLFLALFALPAILALPLAARLYGPAPRWPRAVTLRASIALAAGSLAGLLAAPAINSVGRIHIPVPAPIDPARVLAAYRALLGAEDDPIRFVLDRFFEHLGAGFRLYWLLWLLLTGALVLAGRRRVFRLDHLGSASRRNLGFFALHTLLSFGITAAATSLVAAGRYGAQVEHHGILFVNRYLTALYAIPLLALALYPAVFLGRRRAARAEAPLIAVLAIACVALAARGGLPGAFPRFRPPGVACLDQTAAKLGWRHGLAADRVARTVNVFSRRGIRVDPVRGDLEPSAWITSRRRAGAAAGYDFVILDQLRSEAAVRDRLGPPDAELDCGGLRVWAWEEPRGG